MSDEWKELLLDDSTHEWETELTTHGMKVKYRLHPEQPIIKKSGGTWVTRFNGVDWMCVEPSKYRSFETEIKESFIRLIKETKDMNGIWKLFPIEITDEIAKLRPIVIIGNTSSERSTLAMVRQNRVFNVLGSISYSNDIKLCRLATVTDLD